MRIHLIVAIVWYLCKMRSQYVVVVVDEYFDLSSINLTQSRKSVQFGETVTVTTKRNISNVSPKLKVFLNKFCRIKFYDNDNDSTQLNHCIIVIIVPYYNPH